MSKARLQEKAGGVKLLAFLLALLLWCSVALERGGEAVIEVPVLPEHLPAGLGVSSPLPAKLDVTVSGPRILLCRLAFRSISCGLDLSGTPAGTSTVTLKESWFGLGPELKVVRVFPAAITLTLAREGAR